MRYYVFNIRSNWFVIDFLRSSDWIKEFRLFHSSLHSYTIKNCFNQTMIQSRLTETVLADGVLNGLKIGRTERPMRRLKQQPMPNRSRSLLLHNLFTLSSVFTSHRAHRRRAKNIFMEKNTKNHRRICLDYRKPLFFPSPHLLVCAFRLFHLCSMPLPRTFVESVESIFEHKSGRVLLHAIH